MWDWIVEQLGGVILRDSESFGDRLYEIAQRYASVTLVDYTSSAWREEYMYVVAVVCVLALLRGIVSSARFAQRRGDEESTKKVFRPIGVILIATIVPSALVLAVNLSSALGQAMLFGKPPPDVGLSWRDLVPSQVLDWFDWLINKLFTGGSLWLLEKELFLVGEGLYILGLLVLFGLLFSDVRWANWIARVSIAGTVSLLAAYPIQILLLSVGSRMVTSFNGALFVVIIAALMPLIAFAGAVGVYYAVTVADGKLKVDEGDINTHPDEQEDQRVTVDSIDGNLVVTVRVAVDELPSEMRPQVDGDTNVLEAAIAAYINGENREEDDNAAPTSE